MSQNAVSGDRAGRRYNWCPGCGELWLAAWMTAAGVDRCPSCDRGVFPYIGRSPYDTSQACADGRAARMGRRQQPPRAEQRPLSGVPGAAITGRL
jgi:hypothetical protein